MWLKPQNRGHKTQQKTVCAKLGSDQNEEEGRACEEEGQA